MQDENRNHEGSFLTLFELVEAVGIPAPTLLWWHQQGRGPRSFEYLGRRLYREAAISEWLRQTSPRSARSAALCSRTDKSSMSDASSRVFTDEARAG